MGRVAGLSFQLFVFGSVGFGDLRFPENALMLSLPDNSHRGMSTLNTLRLLLVKEEGICPWMNRGQNTRGGKLVES